ncbi:hypothetical protein Clacol_000155 [Clathrus columnatus]|uniref:Uncharacterized protein n=1 Tax=Clathrus columnatus TaxID=1419009 RepID=A0AAV4ZZZ7_9AGAM|nr:hypothetical protein Clacol_000155 [Clathrus columnatus]
MHFKSDKILNKINFHAVVVIASVSSALRLMDAEPMPTKKSLAKCSSADKLTSRRNSAEIEGFGPNVTTRVKTLCMDGDQVHISFSDVISLCPSSENILYET